MNAIVTPVDPAIDPLDAMQSIVEAEIAAKPTAAGGIAMPYGFHLRPTGLYREPPQTPGVESPPIRVSDPFEVAGECEDGEGGEWAVFIKWTDRAGHPHAWSVPHRLIRAMRGELAAELASNGLHVEVGEEQAIRRFLGGVRHTHRLQCVDRAGWHTAGGPVFVLPGNQAFGPNAPRVVLQAGRVATGRAFKPAGSLEIWQRDIAQFAIGNNRLALFLSAAFTGPLLDIVSEPSGGLHLVGKSQSGKSTAALVAASVWGRGDREGQVRQWRGTANGVEGIASEATDTVLVLDEIGQADPKEVGEIVYMLANGAGKVRANQMGGARDCRTWRVLLLSTGEITLEARMGEVGKKAQAGLGVRLVNLPADAGAGLGRFKSFTRCHRPPRLPSIYAMPRGRVTERLHRRFSNGWSLHGSPTRTGCGPT